MGHILGERFDLFSKAAHARAQADEIQDIISQRTLPWRRGRTPRFGYRKPIGD